MNAAFTTLHDIRATASADGVEATVTVDGRVVALTIDPKVLSTGPTAVAALILRVAQEASTTALNLGVEALTPLVAPELADELRALVLPNPAPAAKPAPPPAADDVEVRSWAVPH